MRYFTGMVMALFAAVVFVTVGIGSGSGLIQVVCIIEVIAGVGLMASSIR